MIEVAFSEGTSASLKNCINMNFCKDLFAHSESVPPLSLFLDMGDISDTKEILSGRSKVLNLLYDEFPDVPSKMEEFNKKSFSYIFRALNSNEKIRIWICENDPNEICGLYFLCSLFNENACNVSIVNVPSPCEIDGEVLEYRSSAAIDSPAFCKLARFEKSLSEKMRRHFALAWDELAAQNASLRAKVNGKVISVPEDFYDHLLISAIEDGQFHCALLLGKALNAMPGVGDRWLYLRIEKMLADGRLIEVEPSPSDHPYMAILKRGRL